MEPDLIDLSTFHDLAKAEIGAFSPKPTSIEGDQLEAVRSFFQSPDGTVDIGIWECTPGRFTADRSDSSEICHIISEHGELSRIDGEVREVVRATCLFCRKAGRASGGYARPHASST